jgi:RNase P/RNase MRP subunit POP5
MRCHRYLLTEVIFADGKADPSIKWGDLLRAIKDGVQAAHGDYGSACVASSLQIKCVVGQLLLSCHVVALCQSTVAALWLALTCI